MDNVKKPTIQTINELLENVRVELVNGQLYYHEVPLTIHQEIVGEICYEIGEYIRQHKYTDYKVCIRPVAVFLKNDTAYVEPDVFLVCDKNKLDEKGCHGAPDWIIEVASQKTGYLDGILKLSLYASEGVKEYWVVNPDSRKVIVYNLEKGNVFIYNFEKVKSTLLEGFEMDFSMFGKLIISGYNVNTWWSEEDNCYLAEVLELPGCMADAETLEELYQEVEEHIQMWKEVEAERLM